jgi:quercetin dioxygenase-like cupin family protein
VHVWVKENDLREILSKVACGEKQTVEKSKKVEKAQTIEMAGFVEYQEGSIVSRTIIDKKAGTITFFAFDEGQGLSEHVAPYDALVSILEGEAQVEISGKTLNLKNGEMIILPANKPHALKAIKKFKMMLIMIKA